MKHLLNCSILCVGLLFTPIASHASPISTSPAVAMSFNSVGGASNGADYIYPYLFSINGSSTLTPLMCVLFDNNISVGETWTATQQAINTSSSTVAQEDAYLFSLIGGPTYSINDIQEAVWFLSASNPASVPITANDPLLLSLAAQAVGGPNTASFDNGQFSIYVANDGSQTAGFGQPQNFVGISPTPEPSSLLLLTTGVLGAAGIVRFRHRRSAQSQTA
jgi:PEP-CTERM motif